MVENTLINQIMTSGVTACFTMLGGVIVFVFGQIAIKFFIEPIQNQTILINQIVTDFTFYANKFGNTGSLPTEQHLEIQNILRRHSGDLKASVHTIKWYRLWQFLRLVTKKEDVISASTNIMGLSNQLNANNIDDWQSVINRLNSVQTLLGFIF